MIRSRVSLATGWMSEGSGPAVLCHALADYTRHVMDARHEQCGRE